MKLKTIGFFFVIYISLVLINQAIIFTSMGLGTHVRSAEFPLWLMNALGVLSTVTDYLFIFPATYLGRTLPENLIFLNIYIIYFIYAVVITAMVRHAKRNE